MWEGLKMWPSWPSYSMGRRAKDSQKSGPERDVVRVKEEDAEREGRRWGGISVSVLFS